MEQQTDESTLQGGKNNVIASSSGETFKIEDVKILKIDKNSSIENLVDKKIQIINIRECSSTNDAIEIIKSLNLINFPNIFAFSINVLKRDAPLNDLCDVINEKVDKNRSILVEVCGEFKKTFEIIANPKVFYCHCCSKTMQGCNEYEISDFPESLSEKYFLSILNSLDCPFFEVDLGQILELFNHKIDSYKLYLNAIESRDEVGIRLLIIFNPKLLQSLKGEDVSKIIRSCKSDIFLAILNIFEHHEVEKEQVEEILKIDENAFMTAVEQRNSFALRILLKFSSNLTFFNFCIIEKAINFAFANEYFDMYKEIRKKKFNLPLDEQNLLKLLTDNCDRILDEISVLHQNIEDGNLNKIKEFIKKYPNLKLCYGKEVVCALEWAIDCKQFEIYVFLRSKEFTTDNSDQLWQRIEILSDHEKAIIRDENVKSTLDKADSLKNIAGLNCFLINGKEGDWEKIQEIINDLNKVGELHEILNINILAAVKFFFDLNNERINVFDPTQEGFVESICYQDKKLIFISKCNTKSEFYGAFAREITQIAMNEIYSNNCMPYYFEDSDRNKLFSEILISVRQNYFRNLVDTDPIIRRSFDNYKNGYLQCIQLIARVSEVLAYYFGEDQKIATIETNLNELFAFYRHCINIDFKKAFIFQKSKLNADFGLLKKIEDTIFICNPTVESEIIKMSCGGNKRLLISSNVPILTIGKIKQEIVQLNDNVQDYKSKTIFVDLKKLEHPQILASFNEIVASSTIDRVVVDAKNANEENLELLVETYQSDVEIIVVVKDDFLPILASLLEPYAYQTLKIEHNWSDLCEASKSAIYHSKVIYQKVEIAFSSLLFNENSIEHLPSNALPLLCNESETKINDWEFNLDDLIPRLVGKEGEYLPMEEYLKSVKDEKVIFVSGDIGAGKTILIKQMREYLANSNDFFINWNGFVDLKLNFEAFEDEIEDFVGFLGEKLLHLNPLEVFILREKFKLKNVIIFFDNFDKLEQDYKTKAIELLKKLKKQSCQIYIAAHGLNKLHFDEELDSKTCEIKQFSLNDRITLVKNYFSQSNNDVSLVKKCAELLVNKMNVDYHMPLPILATADYFRPRLCDNFEPVIENFKIINVYEGRLQNLIACVRPRTTEEILNVQKLKALHVECYEAIALQQFLGNEHHLFGRKNIIDRFNSGDQG